MFRLAIHPHVHFPLELRAYGFAMLSFDVIDYAPILARREGDANTAQVDCARSWSSLPLEGRLALSLVW